MEFSNLCYLHMKPPAPSLGLIFSGTLCSDFARRKLERGKGDKDVETEPGLSLQNLSPTPSSSDAYAEGNL